LEWNSSYRPWFYRDVWPILFRADEMNFVTKSCSNRIPHNQTNRAISIRNPLAAAFVVRSAERKHQSESC